ncbi:NHL repeat-containing protein [Desulfurivibrio dismutans]|uniref:NHL repeat-containing protein n=1 Tax=Desulfurivibrio dismutans TaxID=1398908 RepID=UPI0023DC7F5A|nr:NHL repeat-containing protein [Desulfurivibrio alkaliphilus]MDF1613885.1 NHL repeat-containing protein [Desulfurivibrio alkaliphilus]
MVAGPSHKPSRLLLLLLALTLLSVAGPRAALAYEKILVEFDFAIEDAAGLAMELPTDLTIVDGELYVLDGMNHRVAVYDLEGNYRRQFGSPREIPRAIGICASGDGGLYVPDAETGRLLAYSTRGALLGGFDVVPVQEGEKPDITDCVVSPAGEIFLADNNNHRVQVYNREGERLRHWGRFGEGSSEFRFPATLDIDADGVIFVVDVINNRVKGFRTSGRQAQWLGGWGITPGRLFRPKGVLVVGDRAFVSDSYTGVIQVFRTAGGLMGILADGQGENIRFRTPTNMAFANNRLYVVEQLENRVSVWRLEP